MLLRFRESQVMFVEPTNVDVGESYVLHGCPACRAKLITLLLITPTGARAEYKLLICEQVSKAYLQDLYNLYIGRVRDVTHEMVSPVTTIYVDEIVNPKEWLNCVKWARYRCKSDLESLELFIDRPKNPNFFYALGTSGTMLIGKNEEIIKIHNVTLQTLTGKTTYTCRKPVINVIESRTQL